MLRLFTKFDNRFTCLRPQLPHWSTLLHPYQTTSFLFYDHLLWIFDKASPCLKPYLPHCLTHFSTSQIQSLCCYDHKLWKFWKWVPLFEAVSGLLANEFLSLAKLILIFGKNTFQEYFNLTDSYFTSS